MRNKAVEKSLTVGMIEDYIWKRDHVRVIIRAPGCQVVKNFTIANIPQSALIQTMTVHQYLIAIVQAVIVYTIPVHIITGSGEMPHDEALIRSVQNSYH